MRRFGFVFLVLAMMTGACSRGDANAALGTNAAGQPEGNTAPVATSGASATAVPPDSANANGAPAERRVAWREVTIPAGTRLPLILDTSIASNTSHVEQPVQAHLARAVSVNGVAVLPEGSRVSGVVTDAAQSGKVKGRAHLAVRFDTLTPHGAEERYQIAASAVGRTAPATKKNDALKIGAPAAGGAAIGAIIGGKKGALIGTAAGGGAGTAVVLSTRGKEVSLARGTALTIQLVEPLTVKVRG